MMEGLKNNPESAKEKYYFPEILSLKERMTALALKMKESIDSGKYSVLVSDEVGGRIPTLILRELIKSANPEKEIQTFFIASGKSYLHNLNSKLYEDYLKFFSTKVSPEDHLLLITQYIHSGGTIADLSKILKDAGVVNIDIAVARSLLDQKTAEYVLPNADNIFIGENNTGSERVDEESVWFTGVGKDQKPESIFPKKLANLIETEGRGRFVTEKEYDSFFGIEDNDKSWEVIEKSRDPKSNYNYDEYAKSTLTEEEKVKLQENINKVRKDINTLATEIFEEVWKK